MVNRISWANSLLKRMQKGDTTALDALLVEYGSLLRSQGTKMVNKTAISVALEALTPYENEILYYTYWECIFIRDIAVKVGKPYATVRYDLKNCLKKLKKLLK